MPRAVIVGGSVAGLMSSVLLARAGWDVAVVERDPLPVEGGPEHAWTAWPRPAVPQSGHSHNFFARLRVELAERAPDLLARLHAAGVEDLHIGDHVPPGAAAGLDPGDTADLVALICRRSTFEWGLRRAALDEPGVTAVVADVAGLLADPGSTPRVTGVRLSDGSLDADLVVDASGRRSRAGKWLEDLGAGPLDFDSVDCGVTYFTRYYRLRDPAGTWPTLTRGLGGGANFPTHMCAAFPADRRAYSVTLGIPPWVEELRDLRDTSAFEALIAVSPATTPWGEGGVGEPITEVRVLAGMRNGIRRSASVTPPALGFALIGDAFMHTNPAMARGVPMATIGAARLVGTLTAHPDPADWAGAWASELAHLAATYFDDVLDRDVDRAELWGATWAGRTPQVTPVADDLQIADIMRASTVDGQVWRSFQRALNLLDPPTSAWSPDVASRVQALRDSGALPVLPPPPTPDEVLAAVSS